MKECELQEDTAIESIYNMFRAYEYAQRMYKKDSTIFYNDVMYLGQLVKPETNRKGIRTTPVIFKDLSLGLAPELIEHTLKNFLTFQREISVDQFYKIFEQIHPFEDGNGRVGAILYNMLNNSMDDPILPPDLF
jgi:hypothetical protein